MPLFHDVEQNSEEWNALRCGKATGSNFGCFMANYGKAFGDPAQRYALQIALEIMTGQKAQYSFSNEHMERGMEQEPIARMRYQELMFCDVGNGGFFDCGRYGDSPDGLVGKDGIVEIKSVIAPTHYATIQRGNFDPSYRWQLIGHLDCSERQWVDFVSYCSDFPTDCQLVVYRLDRDSVKDELVMLRNRRADFLAMVDSTIENINKKANAA